MMGQVKYDRKRHNGNSRLGRKVDSEYRRAALSLRRYMWCTEEQKNFMLCFHLTHAKKSTRANFAKTALLLIVTTNRTVSAAEPTNDHGCSQPQPEECGQTRKRRIRNRPSIVSFFFFAFQLTVACSTGERLAPCGYFGLCYPHRRPEWDAITLAHQSYSQLPMSGV